MLDKQAKAKLDKFMIARERNLARLIYITYRHFNEWSQKQWEADGWGQLRPDHLKLVSIVGIEAVNNNELAKRARVSKQAMSKTVMDLVEMGFVNIEADPNDSRAKIISISSKGVDFLTYLNKCSRDFEVNQYHKILGKKKTDQLVDLLSELANGILVEYHKNWAKPGKK